MIKTDINKIKNYIANEFRHFTNVTGYPVEINFQPIETVEGDPYSMWQLTGCSTRVIVYIDDMFPYLGWEKHYKRLIHLKKRINKRFPFIDIDLTLDRYEIEPPVNEADIEVKVDKEAEEYIKKQPAVEITKEMLNDAEKASIYNRESIDKSNICGCYSCCRIFSASEITDDDYCDEGKTACCPHCGIDAVIGDASGYPITPDFMRKMHIRWGDF